MIEFEDIVITKELMESMYNQELEYNGIVGAKQKRKNYYKIIYDESESNILKNNYKNEIGRIYYLNLKIENQDDFEYVKDIIEKYKITTDNELNYDELVDTEFNFCLSVKSEDKETQQYIETILIDSINKADPLYTINSSTENIQLGNPNKKDKETLLDNVNISKLGLVQYTYINEEKVLKESDERMLYEMSLYNDTNPYIKSKESYESNYIINFDENNNEIERIYYFNILIYNDNDLHIFNKFREKHMNYMSLEELSKSSVFKIEKNEPTFHYNIRLKVNQYINEELINDIIEFLNYFKVNDSILFLSLNGQLAKI
jgi:hypothetical protein